MNIHPDTVAAAALGIHHERLAAANHAELVRHALRLQPVPRPRQPLPARFVALVTVHSRRRPVVLRRQTDGSDLSETAARVSCSRS
jgi:hypothetical protein